MVCQSCGNPAQGTFCSHCGAPIAVPPTHIPPPAYPYPLPEQRVTRHIQTLGILWCVFGAYRALTGIVGAIFMAGIGMGGFPRIFGDPNIIPFMGRPWMAGLATVIAVLTFLFAGLSFLVGYALLNRKPWGRTLAIVLSILELIKIPFGTALGIYTLWVLAPSLSGAEYDALAARP